jgi:hypothetical protein
MPNSIIPTQLGYTAPKSSLRSQVFIGKNTSVDFEAVGLGEGGRPDELQALKIYLNSLNSEKKCVLHFDISDVETLLESQNFNEFFLKIREVSVCQINDDTDESEEKKMLILGSEPY